MNETELLNLAIQLLALVRANAWAPLAAVAVGALVRLAKADRLGAPWRRVPRKWRSLVVLGLGLVAGGLEMVAAGAPIEVAITHGALAAFAAMFGHEVLIEIGRHGRELFAPPDDAPPTLRSGDLS